MDNLFYVNLLQSRNNQTTNNKKKVNELSKNLKYVNNNIIINNEIDPQNGLKMAYDNVKNGSHLYSNNDSLFIAGSYTAQDWLDNFKYIGISDNIKQHNIYKEASEFIKNNNNIKNVYGHSAGAAAATQIGIDNPELKITTYNNPGLANNFYLDNPNNINFTNNKDLVSLFNKGLNNIQTNSSLFTSPLNNHSYLSQFGSVNNKSNIQYAIM